MTDTEKMTDILDPQEARRQRMITEPLLPLLIRTAIPTMIGMLVAMIYNLTDTFWVARLDNTAMTAAVGVVFSFFTLTQALGFWFGYGSGNTMSRLLGSGNRKEAEIISSTGIVLATVLGTLLMVLCLIFLRPLAGLIGGSASEELMSCTVSYLRIIVIVIPFSLYATTLYNQFRLCGNVKDGMTGLAVGMITNIVIDPLLILVFHMGVTGAGLATLIGQVLSCVLLTSLSFKNGNIPVTFRKFSLKNRRWYHICMGGAPNFCRQGITSLASVLLNNVAVPYGTDTIAALTIAGRVAMLVYSLMIGFGQGFQPICAMNYGAKKYDRVNKVLKMTVGTGTAFMILGAVVIYIFAEPLIGIFSTEQAVVEAGVRILRYQCFALPFLAVYAISSMYMQNIGMYWRALVISVSRQGLFYIPALYILTGSLGVLGIYIVQPVADVLSFGMALAIVIFSAGKTHLKET